MTVVYFGCIGRPGHHYWASPQRSIYMGDAPGPWKSKIDGGLLNRREPTGQGEAVVAHLDGWSCCSFCDRTVDHRGGSNSAFLVDEPDLTLEQILDRARAAWPMVFARFPWPIVARDDIDRRHTLERRLIALDAERVAVEKALEERA